jgi:hypothetical protein
METVCFRLSSGTNKSMGNQRSTGVIVEGESVVAICSDCKKPFNTTKGRMTIKGPSDAATCTICGEERAQSAYENFKEFAARAEATTATSVRDSSSSPMK